jgi:hypothetical protein
MLVHMLNRFNSSYFGTIQGGQISLGLCAAIPLVPMRLKHIRCPTGECEPCGRAFRRPVSLSNLAVLAKELISILK